MNKPLKQSLLWVPRSLGILIVAFLFLFSLDVLEMGANFWQILGGLFMHNIPALILLVLLILSWRREWVGAAAFIGFGIWYLAAVRGFPPSIYLVMAGVPILTGVLFLIGWFLRKTIGN